MERTPDIIEAKEIMGSNFIGPTELAHFADKMAIKVPTKIPIIHISLEELKNKHNDYLLILGASQMQNEQLLTIKSLRNHFGIDPDISEPCFYNQDWYLKESFIEEPLETKWFLIRKNVFKESRQINPETLKNNYEFPSAILCAYSFFALWYFSKEKLWEHDFVWCKDLDHNGDRIYIGKYHDIDGVNKNGFSIHRHLRIQNHYGAIDIM